MLSGQGADEPLGGYGRHRAAAALGRARARCPRSLRPPRARSPTRCRATSAPSAPPACSAAMPDVDRLLRLFEVADHGQRARR